jgi:hypothetical protein
MQKKQQVTGALLLLAGVLVGIGYPLVLVVWREKAVELLIYTFVALAILIGAFIGAVGIILLRGFNASEDAENTS